MTFQENNQKQLKMSFLSRWSNLETFDITIEADGC